MKPTLDGAGAVPPDGTRRAAIGALAALVGIAALAATAPAFGANHGANNGANNGERVSAPVSLAQPHIVVLLRHANAPGVGDPDGFRLGDCPTQRNLDARGRQQARRLGASWRAAGFRPTKVWTSAWCRCQHTAELLEAGPVTVLPLLNSFFGNSAARGEQTQALARFIEELDPRKGPYLMVTHQVNITALTGEWADSAGGVVIELPRDGRPQRKHALPAAF